MWPRNWTNFAPFAGFMLKRFKKEVALKRASEKLTNEGGDERATEVASL
jgi:hypothetical protein